MVSEGDYVLLAAVAVLDAHFDLDTVLPPLEEQHLGMNRGLVLVEVLDELDDPALVQERVAPLVALVLDDDLEPLVEERQLAQAIGERVEGERRLLEDLWVGLEADDGAVLRGLLALGELVLRHAVLVVL